MKVLSLNLNEELLADPANDERTVSKEIINYLIISGKRLRASDYRPQECKANVLFQGRRFLKFFTQKYQTI